jgi:hypothetical protein
VSIRYAIQYRYPGTVNGEPVGYVFAQDIGRVAPGCWSYTAVPHDATLFSDWESADAVRQQKRWPESSVVPVELPKDAA